MYTYGQILLVGKDQQNGIPQLILVQHALELLAGLNDTVAIVAVDDEDDSLRVAKVMPPQRTDFVVKNVSRFTSSGGCVSTHLDRRLNHFVSITSI